MAGGSRDTLWLEGVPAAGEDSELHENPAGCELSLAGSGAGSCSNFTAPEMRAAEPGKPVIHQQRPSPRKEAEVPLS